MLNVLGEVFTQLAAVGATALVMTAARHLQPLIIVRRTRLRRSEAIGSIPGAAPCPWQSGRAMCGDRASVPETRWPAMTLLGRLSERPRRELLELGTSVKFDSGRTILREGEPGHTAYLLLRGCVKVRGNEAEWEPLLAIRIGGDLIGEMAVLSRKPRSASVLTCSQTTARAVPAEELRRFLLRCPEVTLEIASILSERLRWSNERRVDAATLDPRGRVSRVLLALAETYGRNGGDGCDLGAPLTQAEIAALAGIRLPTAEKALRGFAEAGLIRLGYRTTVVLDPDTLRKTTQP